MMKGSIAAACAAVAASVAFAAPAYAVTVTVGGTSSPSSGDFSAVAGVTTVDFDGANPAGWSIGGDHEIVSGSLSGYYAAPPDTNDSQYLTVPRRQSSGAADITLGGSYNYYGLYWGSIDDYNTLTFLNGDETVFTFTGTDAAALIPTQPNGNQGLAAYFNFFNLPQFTGVRLLSAQYAFETDNHAFGRVPVPATAALFALGLLGLATTRRGRLQ